MPALRCSFELREYTHAEPLPFRTRCFCTGRLRRYCLPEGLGLADPYVGTGVVFPEDRFEQRCTHLQRSLGG